MESEIILITCMVEYLVQDDNFPGFVTYMQGGETKFTLEETAAFVTEQMKHIVETADVFIDKMDIPEPTDEDVAVTASPGGGDAE